MDKRVMIRDINETKKVCPLCKIEYPGEDNYCGRDGSPLEVFTAKPHSSGVEGRQPKRESKGVVDGEKI